MHRVLYKQFLGEAQEQNQYNARNIADLLHAVEKYPDQAARYLYQTFVEVDKLGRGEDEDSASSEVWADGADPCLAICSSSEDDADADGFATPPSSLEYDAPSTPPPCKKRKRNALKLQLSPGRRGFELLEGPNVVMFYSDEPRQQVARCPVVIRPSKCRRKLEMRPVAVDGSKILQACDQSGVFARLEAAGLGNMRHLIGKIAYNLSIQDVFNCMLVCKSWHATLVKDNAAMWKFQYERMCRVPSVGQPLPIRDNFRLTCRYFTLGAGLDGCNVSQLRRAGHVFDQSIQNYTAANKAWPKLVRGIIVHYLGEGCGVIQHRQRRASGHKFLQTIAGEPPMAGHTRIFSVCTFEVDAQDTSKVHVAINHSFNVDTGKGQVERRTISFADLVRPYLEVLERAKCI